MFVVAVLVTVRTRNCIFGSNGCVGRALVQQCAVYVMDVVSSHWLLCVLLARLAIGYCASSLHCVAIGYCASFLHCVTIGYCVLLASWHWLLRALLALSSHWLLCVLLESAAPAARSPLVVRCLAIGYCASFLHCLAIGYLPKPYPDLTQTKPCLLKDPKTQASEPYQREDVCCYVKMANDHGPLSKCSNCHCYNLDVS